MADLVPDTPAVPAPSGIVTLLSDFGLQDPFVGVMEGVILGIAPQAQRVHLTHAIPPQDVGAASFLLAESCRHFPAGTVHLAVVDPGVGSERRALAALIDDQYYVLPDNGLISDIWLGAREVQATISIEDRRFALPEISRTFHGRDIFAPAAAHLAAGLPIAALGPCLEHPALLQISRPRPQGNGLCGRIRHVDRFGNLITNIHDVQVDIWAAPALDVQIGGHTIHGRCQTYADVPAGELAVVVNSFGLIEIAVNGGSAAERLGVGTGANVRVFPADKL